MDDPSFLTIYLISLAAAMIFIRSSGRRFIARMADIPGMKWSAREDTPDTHRMKHGTPSMGGIAIIGSALLAYFGIEFALFTLVFYFVPGIVDDDSFAAAYFNLRASMQAGVLPLYVVLHSALGVIDDWSKAKGRGGLRAGIKFCCQCLLAIGLLATIFNMQIRNIWLYDLPSQSLLVRGNDWQLMLAGLLLTLVLVGTCNAVNLTDGIDGLAAGLAFQCGIVLLLAPSINVLDLRISWFWAALAGACLGFLTFNRYPAKVFMGDTGSLALGAALAGACVLTQKIWLLPFIGFIFYIEMFSVIAQVLYFKYTRIRYGHGVRLLRRAPLHHHFELCGYSETRVVAIFWAVNFVTSSVGLVLWSMKVLPAYP